MPVVTGLQVWEVVAFSVVCVAVVTSGTAALGVALVIFVTRRRTRPPVEPAAPELTPPGGRTDPARDTVPAADATVVITPMAF